MIRQKLLMCAPIHYDVKYVINPWMAGNVHHASKERAAAQWQRLHDTLAGLAEVQLVEPQAGWPDMVFTANAGLLRGRRVALSHFHCRERQGEEPHFGRWFESAGLEVLRMPDGVDFEGEGDALFATDRAALWAGYGFRTSRASHAELERQLGVKVRPLGLVDARFYHLDTCFAPLSNGDVMYFPGAFDAESLERIEDGYAAERRIAVDLSDALRFACNVVCLGRTLVLNTISSELRRDLEVRGFDVIELPLDEFLKAGGAAKCLVLHLD